MKIPQNTKLGTKNCKENEKRHLNQRLNISKGNKLVFWQVEYETRERKFQKMLEYINYEKFKYF